MEEPQLGTNPTLRQIPQPLPKERGQFIVSFFGRLSSEKAPRVFIEIANRLKGDPSIRFYMTGAGPERDAVLELIKRYRLTDRIYVPGFVPNVRPLMEQSDVVVLPSIVDGMPLTVLEAQTLGKPVVASRVGSLPAMVADGETGFLCDAGDIAMFCLRISQLKQSPELRARVGDNARIRATAAFGAEKMLAEYLALIRELLGTPPAGCKL
jgi:glycosyltransferase involved in cell wall biosynthesis